MQKKAPSRSHVTYDVIAAHANVSRTTVSLVLRGLARERISPETYARVEEASRELGYYTNRLVQAMQSGRTEIIAVLAPPVGLEHAARILDGIRDEAGRKGYAVLLGAADKDPADERPSAERLLQHRADGMIRFNAIQEPGKLPDWLAEAISRGIPCVLVDDADLAGQVDCVVSDDEPGAYQAVVHLLEQGHRRIAHYRGHFDSTAAAERAAGYQRAMREYGVDYERFVGFNFSGTGTDDVFESLFGESEPPTALFCCADSVASNALRWLHAKGRRVPEDVAIVGFAGTFFSSHLEISSVAQPFEAMGATAVQRILQRIEGDPSPFQVDRLPTELIVRGSSSRWG